jgi:hypothetical protein
MAWFETLRGPRVPIRASRTCSNVKYCCFRGVGGRLPFSGNFGRFWLFSASLICALAPQEQSAVVGLMWEERGYGMTPGEIRACYRLYAAHRRSHEICTFPETIPIMNNARDLDDLAVLLRLHTGLERLARGIAQRDPGDHLCPSAAGHVGHLRKMLASFAAQLFGRGALVGR